MKLHTFHKHHSNIQVFTSVVIAELVSITLVTVYMFLYGKSFIQTTTVILLVLTLLISWPLLPYLGKTGKYRWRLNTLFEVFARTVSFSEKNIFPVVKYGYNQGQDYFVFVFEWKGRVSSGVQTEIIHRLSETLFPKNEYLLEEPLITPAFTKFLYTRKPERLRIRYEIKKRNTAE